MYGVHGPYGEAVGREDDGGQETRAARAPTQRPRQLWYGLACGCPLGSKNYERVLCYLTFSRKSIYLICFCFASDVCLIHLSHSFL